jgi:large subunit ribosomal protein L23
MNEKGKYGFLVESSANKVEIKRAVEKQYRVNVEKVNTMNVMGKMKTRYTKTGILSGRQQNYKKAIVTLAEGEVIDFYSNV